MAEQVELASEVYRHYAALMRLAADSLGGQFLLAAHNDSGSLESGSKAGIDEHDRSTEVLVRAANIAGAATLLLCEREHFARDQVRNGVCDFLVTNLDEALRILKNELRRKQPVAVCLLGRSVEILAACVERGVQPQLLGVRETTLEARGARVLRLETWADEAGEDRSSAASLVHWTAAAEGARQMAKLDGIALASVKASRQAVEQRWLSRAPQYLGRSLGGVHVVAMETGETDRFVEAVVSAIRSGAVTAGTRIRRGDELLV